MVIGDGLQGSDEFELLASLTAQLASTARLDDIVDTVLSQIVALAWRGRMAVVTSLPESGDAQGGHRWRRHHARDAKDLHARHAAADRPRFRERRMINITDPDRSTSSNTTTTSFHPASCAPRVIYEHTGTVRVRPIAGEPRTAGRRARVVIVSWSAANSVGGPVHGLLRALRDHLGIAMERALQLANLQRLNADLVKAQAAIVADARMKAVGELASAVAHDLNNLCGIALMAVSVGLRSPTDASAALPRIERANRAVGDLVARLQRVARPSPSEVQTADLRQIVDDILVMMRPLLQEQSIHVDVELPAVPAVRCDPSLVHQVVLNLVINAHDALTDVPDERRRLSIAIRRDDGAVRLMVADTGHGIAADVKAKLFQPFVTTKGGAHLGLGLAAAHASLKHFGGQIEGHNASDGGARFEVTFPVASSDQAATRFVPPRASMRQRAVSVLAVDDDPDIIEVIRAYLEPLGFDVITSQSADEALSIAGRRPFDLVLCDVGLPKRSEAGCMHGAARVGCSAARADDWLGQSHSANDRRAAQCDRLLAKPFVGADLTSDRRSPSVVTPVVAWPTASFVRAVAFWTVRRKIPSSGGSGMSRRPCLVLLCATAAAIAIPRPALAGHDGAPELVSFSLADGNTMAGYVYGRSADHPLVIMVHGASDSHTVFDFAPGYRAAADLAKHGYGVLTVDRVGYGASSHPNGDTLGFATAAAICTRSSKPFAAVR
jgi:signal transduction histidine kinase/CheY-like chemotaxis protein